MILFNCSYCLRTTIADATGSLMVTCYSPAAHSLLPPITELLSYVSERDPYKIPSIVRDLENTNHRFTLHFSNGSRKRYPRFILDDAKDCDTLAFPSVDAIQPLPALLPAPPVETQKTSLATTPDKPEQTASAAICEPDSNIPATESSFTEIPFTTLTPPPGYTDTKDKRKLPEIKEETVVKKQLFKLPETKNEGQPMKKPKKNDSSFNNQKRRSKADM